MTNIRDEEEEVFEALIRQELRNERSAKMFERMCVEEFGCVVPVIAKLWIAIVERFDVPPVHDRRHLLWALYFLANYPKEAVGARHCSTTPKTFRFHVRTLVWLLSHCDLVRCVCVVDARERSLSSESND